MFFFCICADRRTCGSAQHGINNVSNFSARLLAVNWMVDGDKGQERTPIHTTLVHWFHVCCVCVCFSSPTTSCVDDAPLQLPVDPFGNGDCRDLGNVDENVIWLGTKRVLSARTGVSTLETTRTRPFTRAMSLPIEMTIKVSFFGGEVGNATSVGFPCCEGDAEV